MTSADGIEQGIGRLLLAFERLAATRRRALGIGANEEVVLLFLGRGTSAPTELSRAIGMTTAGMTNLLDRLEADGFIRREPHASDKRRVLITLTKKGFRAQLELVAVNGELEDLAVAMGVDASRIVDRFLREAAEHVERRAATSEA